MEDNCPKCGSKIRLKNHDTGVNRWYCGTIGPDSKGEYHTSLLCDHTMTIAVSCLLETYLEFKMATEAGLEQRYVEGKQYPIWVSKEGKQ